jgi:hypothetical protein
VFTLPQPTRRPGSARWDDVYPGAGISTSSAGGQGATAEQAAASADASPVAVDLSPQLLAHPAAWLVLGLAAIAALSYLDR